MCEASGIDTSGVAGPPQAPDKKLVSAGNPAEKDNNLPELADDFEDLGLEAEITDHTLLDGKSLISTLFKIAFTERLKQQPPDPNTEKLKQRCLKLVSQRVPGSDALHSGRPSWALPCCVKADPESESNEGTSYVKGYCTGTGIM